MEIKIDLQGYGENLADLCSKVEYTTILHDQPGKLNLFVQKDPNGELSITNGLQVKLTVNGFELFLGYVFHVGMDDEETFKVDCYDQTRYLKREEIYLTKEQTASDIFKQVCSEAGLSHNVKTSTNFMLTPYLHDKKSLYKVIKWGIDQNLINTNQYCFIRDNFGMIEFTDVNSELTDIEISDDQLALSYKYELSITPDTFNFIKVVRNNYETGLRDVWITKDSETMAKWGHLQKLVVADEKESEEQITALSDSLLMLHNRETRTLSVTALGNLNLKAGNGIILKLDRLGIIQNMWINKVTHKFDKDTHIMELELFII